jgi:hypothetical protein
MSTGHLALVAAYVAVFAIYFGRFFFGFKRTLAGTAVIAAIVAIGLLPSLLALFALFAGFFGLVALTAYYHNNATIFTTSVAMLLKDALAGKRLPSDSARAA